MATLKYYDTQSNSWKYITGGQKGDPGEGVPAGGGDGFILVKNGNGDYQTEWLDPNEIKDKNHLTNFTVTDEVLVNHNLSKFPTVGVIDSAGDEIEGEIYHVNNMQLIARFASPFSGKVTCN